MRIRSGLPARVDPPFRYDDNSLRLLRPASPSTFMSYITTSTKALDTLRRDVKWPKLIPMRTRRDSSANLLVLVYTLKCISR